MTPTAGILGALPARRSGRTGIRTALALLLLLAMAGFGVGEWVIASRTEAILGVARHRAEVIAQGRGELVVGWLTRWSDATQPLRANPTVQIFAATMAARGPGATADADLLAYLQTVFDDYVGRRDEIAAARMLDGEGRAFLASARALALDEAQRALSRDAAASGKGEIGRLRESDAGLVYDVFLPVFPAQALTPEAAQRPVAVLALTVRAAPGLAEALAPGRTLEPGESVALLQAEVAASANAALQPVSPSVLKAATRFAEAEGRYVLAEAVPGSPWQVLYARDADAVRGAIVTTRVVVDLLILAALACVAAVGAILWWRQTTQNSLELANQYKEFAAHVEAQHQLLNAINDAIAEEICVVDGNRRVVYVNTAFATQAGRAQAECVGEAVERLLPPALAQRYEIRDAGILRGVAEPPEIVEDAAAEPHRWLLVSKAPLIGIDGQPSGVITVTRDITEGYTARERQRRTMEDTIRVLSSSVAAADPYLANHATRMREFALRIAAEFGCNGEEMETLGTAASLSQIGKIFLPRELIRKETRLTAEQRKTLARHIDLALEALDGIAFELPVPETLALVHERLDGSGYPRGRAGEEINRLGRILAVADVFAARTEPRAYRDAVPSEDVIDILRKHPEKYDAEVVAVLERVVAESQPAET